MLPLLFVGAAALGTAIYAATRDSSSSSGSSGPTEEEINRQAESKRQEAKLKEVKIYASDKIKAFIASNELELSPDETRKIIKLILNDYKNHEAAGATSNIFESLSGELDESYSLLTKTYIDTKAISSIHKENNSLRGKIIKLKSAYEYLDSLKGGKL